MIGVLSAPQQKRWSMDLPGVRPVWRTDETVRTHEVRRFCDHCHVLGNGLMPPDVEPVGGKTWIRNVALAA